MASSSEIPFSADEHDACVRVLQRVADDPSVIADDERLKALIAKIHRAGKKNERRASQGERRSADQAVKQATAMVQRDLRNLPVAGSGVEATAAAGTLRRAASCYVCKQPFTEVHFFYHQLCPACAAFNYAKRCQRADLSGRTALVTGGRIKIGYQVALRLLRDNALRVIVTTRFPADALRRFQSEADFPDWQNRLRIVGLDLRNLFAVHAFAEQLNGAEPHLDILVNNAAQTIKRPRAFYEHLLAGERDAPVLLEALPGYSGGGGEEPAALAAVAPGLPALSWDHFPAGALDADGQQVDKRPANSWALRLGEIGTWEMLETHLVNAVAPFVLCGRLRPLLLRSPFARRFIVNVSAMEGQFGRASKTARHPHTNMAKAALNMLTRTSAADYATGAIYMNSVDTGWITDEKPFARKQRHQESGFHTPLDVLDGAARVYDPVARGILDPAEPVFGQFLKDYAPHSW